jgi:hypothetical protein
MLHGDRGVKMFSSKLMFSLVFAFATYMCSPTDNETSSSECSSSSNNEPDGGLICDQTYDIADSPGSHGTFAAKVTQYAHVNAAGIIEVDTISPLYLLIEYHVEADPMYARVKLCKLEIPQIQIPGQPAPTKLTLSDAIFDNSSWVEVPLTKEGNTTCSQLAFDPAVSLFGVRLNDDMDDPIPTDPSNLCSDGGAAEHQNPCIWDMDGDGENGVTFTAENLPGIEVTEIYMVMRSWTSSNGIVATDDLILGEADWSLEQWGVGCKLIPIGATEERYCNPEEKTVVDNVNPQLGPVEDKMSDFMAVRVDPTITCDEIVQQADDLFGR